MELGWIGDGVGVGIEVEVGDGIGVGTVGGNINLTPGSGSGTGGKTGNGNGVIEIGPCFSPRITISGSVEPVLGENDVQLKLRDSVGDAGYMLFTKQNTWNSTGDGTLKITCPGSSDVGRLNLGAGGWSQQLLISEDGDVHIGRALSPNLAADATYELSVVGDIDCVSINESSDARWKTNIININSGSLDIINNLQPVRYNRIETRMITGSTGNDRYDMGDLTFTSMSEDNTVISSSIDEIGFLAQDVLPYVPEVVSYSSATDKYSLKYGIITAHLVGAIKELKAEIDALKNVSHSHA